MDRPHWYASITTFVNGEMLILGGRDGTDRPELRSTGGTLRLLGGADTNGLSWWYPRLFLAPDGRAFGIADTQLFYVEPSGTGLLSGIGDQGGGTGGVISSEAMFAPGRILRVGGGPGANGTGGTILGATAASIIDINGPVPVITQTAAMPAGLHWQVATLGADGRVYVTGGARQQHAERGQGQRTDLGPQDRHLDPRCGDDLRQGADGSRQRDLLARRLEPGRRRWLAGAADQYRRRDLLLALPARGGRQLPAAPDADTKLRRIGPRCAAISPSTGAWTGSVTNGSAVGPASGTAFTRTCPAGQAVSDLRGRSWSDVDRVELECRKVAGNGALSGTNGYTSGVGGSGGTARAAMRCGTALAGRGLCGKSNATGTSSRWACSAVRLRRACRSVSRASDAARRSGASRPRQRPCGRLTRGPGAKSGGDGGARDRPRGRRATSRNQMPINGR